MDKQHLLNKIALFFAGFLYVWATWQHEIMMKPYMQTSWSGSFQFFTGIILPWGMSYDLTLLVEALAVILGLGALWFWTD